MAFNTKNDCEKPAHYFWVLLNYTKQLLFSPKNLLQVTCVQQLRRFLRLIASSVALVTIGVSYLVVCLMHLSQSLFV